MAAGRLPQGHYSDQDCVGKLQLDLLLVSQSLKRISLLELYPVAFDCHLELLSAARPCRQRKLCTYRPLLEALLSYVERGWQVQILPWVVGVSGMVDEKSVSEILEFLHVSRDWRAKIAEELATESVKAL
jgi:hypothetical protein